MKNAGTNYYRRFFAKGPLKVISIITLWSFLLSCTAGNILIEKSWAVTPSEGLTSVGLSADGPAFPGTIDVNGFTLPACLGTIRDRHDSGSGKVIVHIQDAHCNYAAQKQIKKIIEFIDNKYGVDVINLEGGAGEYDLSLFTDIASPEIRQKVVDHFVMDGLVSGAEDFGINNAGSVILWGVEDVDLYKDNLNSYRISDRNKPRIDEQLSAVGKDLEELKERLYSEELLELDRNYSAYKSGEMDLKEYIVYLHRKAQEIQLDTAGFSNMRSLLDAMDSEKDIDFKKANAERDALIAEMRLALSRTEYEGVVLKTIDLKKKHITSDEFYSYLLKKAGFANINISRFPELEKYARYIALYEQADKREVMEEISLLEDSLKEALAEDENQRRLMALSRNFEVMKRLFGFSLTKKDYEYYVQNLDDFEINRYLSFILRNDPEGCCILKLTDRPVELDESRAEAASFYECGFSRDQAFLENLMVDEGSVSLLVTGGFHTENLCDLLKGNGYSYVSVMPVFTVEEEYECPYFRLLSGRDDPVIKDIKAIVSRSIAIASILNETLSSEVRGSNSFLVNEIYAKWIAACEQGKQGIVIMTDGRVRGIINSQGSRVEGIEDAELENFEVVEIKQAPKGTAYDLRADAEAETAEKPGKGILGRIYTNPIVNYALAYTHEWMHKIADGGRGDIIIDEDGARYVSDSPDGFRDPIFVMLAAPVGMLGISAGLFAGIWGVLTAVSVPTYIIIGSITLMSPILSMPAYDAVLNIFSGDTRSDWNQAIAVRGGKSGRYVVFSRGGKKLTKSEKKQKQARKRIEKGRANAEKKEAERKKKERKNKLIFRSVIAAVFAGAVTSLVLVLPARYDTPEKKDATVAAPVPVEAERTVHMIGHEHLDPALQSFISKYVWNNKAGLDQEPDSPVNRDWVGGLQRIFEEPAVKEQLKIYKENLARIKAILEDDKKNIKVLASENGEGYARGLAARAFRGEFVQLVEMLRRRGVRTPEIAARDLMLIIEGPVAYLVLTQDPAVKDVKVVGLDSERMKQETMAVYLRIMQLMEQLQKQLNDEDKFKKFREALNSSGSMVTGRLSRDEVVKLGNMFPGAGERALVTQIINGLNNIADLGDKRSEEFADNLASTRGNAVVLAGRAHMDLTAKALEKRKETEYTIVPAGKILKGITEEEVKDRAENMGKVLKRADVTNELAIIQNLTSDIDLEGNEQLKKLEREMGMPDGELAEKIKAARKDVLEGGKPMLQFPEIVEGSDRFALGLSTDKFIAYGQNLIDDLQEAPGLRAEFILHEALCFHLQGVAGIEDGHQAARQVQKILFPMNYGKILTGDGDTHPELTGALTVAFQDFINKRVREREDQDLTQKMKRIFEDRLGAVSPMFAMLTGLMKKFKVNVVSGKFSERETANAQEGAEDIVARDVVTGFAVDTNKKGYPVGIREAEIHYAVDMDSDEHSYNALVHELFETEIMSKMLEVNHKKRNRLSMRDFQDLASLEYSHWLAHLRAAEEADGLKMDPDEQFHNAFMVFRSGAGILAKNAGSIQQILKRTPLAKDFEINMAALEMLLMQTPWGNIIMELFRKYESPFAYNFDSRLFSPAEKTMVIQAAQDFLAIRSSIKKQVERSGRFRDVAVSAWNRIPVIGTKISTALAFLHEGFHWLADMGRGNIKVERDGEGRVIGGTYTPDPAKGVKHPAVTALAAPFGMITLSLALYGLMTGVMLMAGMDMSFIICTASILSPVILAPAVDGALNLFSENPYSDFRQAMAAIGGNEGIWQFYTGTSAWQQEWQKKFDSRSETVHPNHIAAIHKKFGIASRETFPEIYNVLDKVMFRNYGAIKELWPEMDLPEDPPPIFLLETDSFQCFYFGLQHDICISLGFLRFLQKYGGGLKEEDIAFAIAHEMGHYIQRTLGVDTKNKMDAHAKEYDADARALKIMDHAGYSVNGIELIFDYFSKMDEDMKKAPGQKRQEKAESMGELIKLIDAGPRTAGDVITKERAKYFALIREAVRGTPPFYAICGKDCNWRYMPYNSGWGGFCFTGTYTQRKHLRDNQKLFDRRDNPFENVQSLSDEEFALRISKDRELLKVILEAYVLNLETERVRVVNPFPYLESHPITKERKAAMVRNRKSGFMGSYDNVSPDISSLFEEVENPTEHQKNIETIQGLNGAGEDERLEMIVKRINEITEWNEIVIFILSMDEGFRTEAVYDELMKRAGLVSDEVGRVLFMHQINYIFGKEDKNRQLPIETDAMWYHAHAPVWVREDIERGGDEVSKACAENVKKFDHEYHSKYLWTKLLGSHFYPNFGENIITSKDAYMKVLRAYMDRYRKHYASGMRFVYKGPGDWVFNSIGLRFPNVTHSLKKEWLEELTEDERIEILDFYFKHFKMFTNDDSYHWKSGIALPVFYKQFKSNSEAYAEAEKRGWDLSVFGDIYLAADEDADWEEELKIRLQNTEEALSRGYYVGNAVYRITNKYYDRVQDKGKFVIDLVKKTGDIVKEGGMNANKDNIYLMGTIVAGSIRERLAGRPEVVIEEKNVPMAYTNGCYLYDDGRMRFFKKQLDSNRAVSLRIEMKDGTVHKVKSITKAETVPNSLFASCDLLLEDGSEVEVSSLKIADVTLYRRNVAEYPDGDTFFDGLKSELKEGLFKDVPELIDGLRSPYSAALLFMISNGMLVSKEDLDKDWFLHSDVDELGRLYYLMKNHIPRSFLEERDIWQLRIPEIKGIRYASQFIDTFDEYVMAFYHMMLARMTEGEYAPDPVTLAGEAGMEGKEGAVLDQLDVFAKDSGERAPFWRRRTVGRPGSDKASPLTVHGRIPLEEFKGKPLGRVDKGKEQGITVGFIRDREKEFVDFLKMRGAIEARKAWNELSWEEALDLVRLNMAPSVLRNYFMCYLFADRLVKRYCDLDMDFLYDFTDLSDAVKGLSSGKRKEVADAFKLSAAYFVNDEYIRNLNENVIERYFASEKFKRFPFEGEARPRIVLEIRDKDIHKTNKKNFQADFRYAEAGTPLNYVDLMLADMFREDLENIVTNMDMPAADAINEIVSYYARPSNSRDKFLMMLIEGRGEELIREQAERIMELSNSANARDRAALIALQLAVDEHEKDRGDISFDEELSLILKYFPDVSYSRDDILSNFERGENASSFDQVKRIRGLMSFDPERHTDNEVKSRVEAEDNITMMLDMVDPGEKINVVMWLAGADIPKPDFILKLELLHFTNMDYLREATLNNTRRYEKVGNKYRRKLLETVLRKGDESIISQGRTVDFVRTLWNSIVSEFNADPDSAESRVIRSSLESLFYNLEGQDTRTVKILTDFMLGMDDLRKDAKIKDLPDSRKMGILAKTLLGATGVIGVKLAQYLGTSTSFGFDADFKKELLELTEDAEALDKYALFTVIRGLKKEIETNDDLKKEIGSDFTVDDLRIKKILAAASIKTCFIPTFEIKGRPYTVNEVWKVKNMSAVYDAKKDLGLMEAVTSDLVDQGIIEEEQQKELMEEMTDTVNMELEFSIEKTNTEDMVRKASERTDESIKKMPFYDIAKKFLKVPDGYNIRYTNVKDTTRNVLIREKLVSGVSLNEYMQTPGKEYQLKNIKNMLLLELLQQVFVDGLYHGDLHPGNVMVDEKGDGTIDVTIIDMGNVNAIDKPEQDKIEALISKVLDWKMRSVFKVFSLGLLPGKGLDVSKEIEELSFKSQKFFDRISYLFGEENLLARSVSKPKKEKKEKKADQAAKPGPGEVVSLRGIEDVYEVFPALKEVVRLRDGKKVPISRMVGKRLRVESAWKVLGSDDPPETGRDFTGVLRRASVKGYETDYMTLDLVFDSFSDYPDKMEHLGRLKQHTYSIGIMNTRQRGEMPEWEPNSNVIVSSIKEVEALPDQGPGEDRLSDARGMGARVIGEEWAAPASEVVLTPALAMKMKNSMMRLENNMAFYGFMKMISRLGPPGRRMANGINTVIKNITAVLTILEKYPGSITVDADLEEGKNIAEMIQRVDTISRIEQKGRLGSGFFGMVDLVKILWQLRGISSSLGVFRAFSQNYIEANMRQFMGNETFQNRMIDVLSWLDWDKDALDEDGYAENTVEIKHSVIVQARELLERFRDNDMVMRSGSFLASMPFAEGYWDSIKEFMATSMAILSILEQRNEDITFELDPEQKGVFNELKKAVKDIKDFTETGDLGKFNSAIAAVRIVAGYRTDIIKVLDEKLGIHKEEIIKRTQENMRAIEEGMPRDAGLPSVMEPAAGTETQFTPVDTDVTVAGTKAEGAATKTATPRDRRQEAVETSLSRIQGKNTVVKTVVGVAGGIEYQAIISSMVNDVNRDLARNGFGVIEVSSTHVQGDRRQILTFEIFQDGPDASEKTLQSYLAAMRRAEELVNKNKAAHPESEGYIVSFVPQIQDGPRLLEKALEEYGKNDLVTLYPDAYTDCDPAKANFTDIDLRSVLARHIASARRSLKNGGNRAGFDYAFSEINDLLGKVTLNDVKLTRDQLERLVSNTLEAEDLDNILLKIEPINFETIVEWADSQKAIDTSL